MNGLEKALGNLHIQGKCYLDREFFDVKPRQKTGVRPFIHIVKFLSCSDYLCNVKRVNRLCTSTFLEQQFFKENGPAASFVLCKNPPNAIRSRVLDAAHTVKELYFQVGEKDPARCPNEQFLLSYLEQATHLRVLNLRMLSLDFRAILKKQSEVNPNLEELYLEYTPVDDDALKVALEMPNLKTLCVSSCSRLRLHVDFKKCKNLQTLSAEYTQLSDSELVNLGHLPTLQRLHVQGCFSVPAYAYIALRYSNIQVLSVNHLQASKVKAISLISTLTELDMGGDSFVTDDAFDQFKPKALRSFIADSSGITNRAMIALANIPTLTRVSLLNCRKLTDSGYIALSKSRSIEHLSMESLKNVV